MFSHPIIIYRDKAIPCRIACSGERHIQDKHATGTTNVFLKTYNYMDMDIGIFGTRFQ